MRTDERLAAVAYTYAWWMTGEDDAAVAALRDALSVPDPAEDSDEARLVALVTGARASLGELRAMCPASELALLHDGLGVPLQPAAELARVSADEATVQLAHGRMEALQETVRRPFAHPERLGGLAVANPPDVAHARQCKSCERARTLIERGRGELREVVSVSAPQGALARLVAEAAPAAAATAGDVVSVHDVLDEPRGYAVAGDDVAELVPPAEAPVDEEPEAAEEAAAPGRRRAGLALAGAGLVTFCVLVVVLIASGGQEAPTTGGEQPAVSTAPDAAGDEDPGEQRTAPAAQPDGTEETFGPETPERDGFGVTAVGVVAPGTNELAASGERLGRRDPLRVAVDYDNATEGVTLEGIWRVDGEPHERFGAVVSGQSGRHVWGRPVPAEGWPPGHHRIVITADGAVVGAVDFRIRRAD
jgi:hypothetical protein